MAQLTKLGQLGEKMREGLLKILQATDTPTICNAIELAQGKRGFNQFTRGTPVAMHQTGRVACGFARVARIAAEEPTTRSIDENKKVRMDYYKYMSEGARPGVCVIQDMDSNPVGAFWGEVNTNIHKGFGLSGSLTNGVIRDLGMCPPDYQVIGGSIGPSHRFVHVLDFALEVEVFGLWIKEGDFVHADRHGACVVPPDILPELDTWIAKMQDLEKIVIEPTQEAGFDFARFAEAWSELEKKRV